MQIYTSDKDFSHYSEHLTISLYREKIDTNLRCFTCLLLILLNIFLESMFDKSLQEQAVNPTEIPGFIDNLNYLDLLRLLKVPNLSEWFLEQALQHREGRVWFFISRHPNITDKLKQN